MEIQNIEKTLIKQENIMSNMVSDDKYISWLINIIYNIDGSFQNTIYDLDFEKDEEIIRECSHQDIIKGKQLFYFYEVIKRYAYENDIPSFTMKDKDYYILKYCDIMENVNYLAIGKCKTGNKYLYYCKDIEDSDMYLLNDYDTNHKVIDFNKIVEENKSKVKIK